MTSRAVRGATTVADNSQEEILAATEELLKAIITNNQIEVRDIVT